jgi:phosphoglycolate phosphatase-like HAD superfamily hydrolase
MGGSPMTKDVIIRDFIRNNLLYGKTVYFGDSRLDYEVALKFGFDFVFLYGYTEFKYWKDYCQSNKIIAFKDFNDLLNAEANK